MNKTCIACANGEFVSEYRGQIRSGTWPKITDEEYEIIKCCKCELAFVSPVPQLDYSTAEYRVSYNGSEKIDDYLKSHDHEQTPRIGKIGLEKFRGKIVLDIGCGGGAFLDAVKGVSKKTIAVEPFEEYHEPLKHRGHEVFSSCKDALTSYEGKIEILVTFGVIEHVEDPYQFILEAKSLLANTGELFIETDNKNDFLMQMDIPEFKKFYYRTAHYWYFNETSLMNLLKRTGFNKINVGYRHGYDLSNVFHWMLERKPTGLAKTQGISTYCNETWKLYLEQSGQAELLHFSAYK